MNFISILEPEKVWDKWPDRAPAYFLDLNIDQILKLIQEESMEYNIAPMYYQFPDREGMSYRREIYRDIKQPEIFESLQKFSENMRHSNHMERMHVAKDNEIQGCMWRTEAIYYYCMAVSGLHDVLKNALAQNVIRSEGLKSLCEYLDTLQKDENFAKMHKDVCAIWEKIKSFRFTLTIQDNRLVMTEGVTKCTYESFLEENFEQYSVAKKDSLRSPYMGSQFLEGLEKKLLMAYFAKYPKLLKEVTAFAAGYVNYKKEELLRLEEEVQFYLSYYRFQRKCQKQGFVFTTAGCDEEKPMEASGVYDLALACVNYLQDKEVVSNDFTYAEGEQFFVVNGPNQGGKTTFARSLGQLVYFSKMGLDVSAASANIHYFTDLLTHFSVEESMESGQGKLMEELNRLSPIMKQNCRKAFVIINELFTTAAHYDGCIMGARVLEHFTGCECKGVYVTHLRELGNACTGVVRLAAMLDGTAAHKRTYRVIRNTAELDGYAEDIVNKYQLSYDDLHERLKKPAWMEGGKASC